MAAINQLENQDIHTGHTSMFCQKVCTQMWCVNRTFNQNLKKIGNVNSSHKNTLHNSMKPIKPPGCHLGYYHIQVHVNGGT